MILKNIPYQSLFFEFLFFKWVKNSIFFNPISYGLSDSVAPTGGPPQDIKEGVNSNPMLLCSICLFVYLGSHAKIRSEISKFEGDFRISKFLEIEISHHNDKRKMAITRLILKIQDWNFVCRPNFNSRTNHVLQLRLSDQLSKFSFF